jgi:GTPase SAR1 family protein
VSTPVLAVVGHPNKGKSSIVATLAHDLSVRIAPEPGTTTRSRRYPMKVDGRILYELVDTPGFQRARRALAWMREHETTAAQHAAVVSRFIETHRRSGEFEDECALLTPIAEGAGILYVVDGSKPYGPEYEPEMEILRWTGRPRMALVNPIGTADHIEEWRAALEQYFGIVRVFNAMSANFTKQVELLRAFGQLDESWTECFDEAVRALEADRRERHRLAARAIAETLVEMMVLVVSQAVSREADPSRAEQTLEKRYLDELRALENRGRRAVERIYDHAGVNRRETAFELLEHDLFAEESWLLWGLTPAQLALTGALGGAAAGGGIDLAAGGASLMLASLVGAAVGAAAAWFGSDRIAEVKIAGVVPLGSKRFTMGPSRNINLPYVILGRALHHQRLVALRTHAHRDSLDVPPPDSTRAWIDELPPTRRGALERCFTRLRKDQDSGPAVDALAAQLEALAGKVDEVR